MSLLIIIVAACLCIGGTLFLQTIVEQSRPFVLSREKTPLAIWYAFDPAILRKRSVRRYTRSGRYIYHVVTTDIPDRIYLGDLVMQLGR